MSRSAIRNAMILFRQSRLRTRVGPAVRGGFPVPQAARRRAPVARSSGRTLTHRSAAVFARFRRGDPGFFGNIVKAVSKVAAPITKIVSTVNKIPVVGPLVTKVGLKAIPVVGQISTVATIAGLAKSAVGVAKGIRSPVTRGPLSLGGGQTFGGGAVRPGIGALAAGAAAAGVGVGLVGSHRQSLVSPQTSGQPRRSTPRRASSSTKGRKCCPAGTKRMVCFKRGRVKKRKAKASKGRTKKTRKSTKSRTAQQRRFAALARKHGGRIPKGTRL